MGKIGQGILGGLSGKVGNVIGASWKGINYIRIKPVSVANPRTEGQVNQRTKFTATLEFLQPSLAFLKIGYKYQANKMSAFNAAMSYILKNAITGEAPNFTVNYPQAMVSRGSLVGPADAIHNYDMGVVTLGWENNSSVGNAGADDKAMILVHNAAKKDSLVLLNSEATRSSGTAEINVPEAYIGDSVHIYLAFQRADGSAVSDSEYIGEIQVG